MLATYAAVGAATCAVLVASSSSRRRRASRSALATRHVPAEELCLHAPLGVHSVALPSSAIKVVNYGARSVTYFGIDVVSQSGVHTWRIMKRYSEFDKLMHRLWKQCRADCGMRHFPRKHATRCTGVALEERRKKLEGWLRRVLEYQQHVPSARGLLHEFLQVSVHASRTTELPLLQEFLQVQTHASPTTEPPVALSVPTLQSLKFATPSLQKEPEAWFRHFNKNGNGLEQHEVIEALQETFPGTHPDIVQEFTVNLWAQFDVNASGCISLQEFLRDGGLREVVLAQMELLATASHADSTSVSGPLQFEATDQSHIVTLEIVIPEGVQAGQAIQVTVPDGRGALVVVPHGFSAGMTLPLDFNSRECTLVSKY